MIVFLIFLVTGCAPNYFLRSEMFLEQKGDLIFSNTQTNPYDFQRKSGQTISFDYSFVVKNNSTKNVIMFSTEKSSFKINDSSVPARCVHYRHDDKLRVNLRPGEYARFDCRVEVTANQQNQLMNKDTVALISIPFNEKETVNFPYKLRIEDFED